MSSNLAAMIQKCETIKISIGVMRKERDRLINSLRELSISNKKEAERQINKLQDKIDSLQSRREKLLNKADDLLNEMEIKE